MFVIGARPLMAATPVTVTFTQIDQYTRQQTMTFLLQDLTSDPSLQNYFSSYVQKTFSSPADFSQLNSFTTSLGELSSNDEDFGDSQPSVGADEPVAESGGLNGNGTSNAGGSVGDVGTGGGVEPEPLLIEPTVSTPIQTEPTGLSVSIALPEIVEAPIILAEPIPVAAQSDTIAPIVEAIPVVTPSQPVIVATNTPVLPPKTLELIEVYPNTNGSDSTEEYVQIKNTGTESVNLKGWILKDASGKKFTLTQDELLAAGATRQLGRPETNITLNNDEEELILLAPDEQIVDHVTYTSAPKGGVYHRSEDGWHWPVVVAASQPTTEPTTTSTTLTPVTPSTVVPATPTTTALVNTPTTVAAIEPTTPAVVIPSPKTLELVELYPNTENNDSEEEFISLKNTGAESVNLKGWTLKDASEKTYTFGQDLFLAAGVSTKLDRANTNITLNNDEETLSLSAPDKELIDFVSYAKAPKGETYIRAGAVWHWSSESAQTQPTNVLQTSVATVTPTTEPTTSTPSASESAPVVTSNQVTTSGIAQMKTKADTAIVNVSGVVSVLPGVLGKQFFYIEDETDGVQIYKNDAIFPDMQIGQRVQIKGELGSIGLERRVKVTKEGSLDVLEVGTVPTPSEKSITELTTASVGKLVRTSGSIVSRASDRILLEQDGHQLEVGISSYAQIDTSALKAGMRLQVTGILRASGSDVKLSPRAQTDLVILEEQKPLVTAGTMGTGKDVQKESMQQTAAVISAGTASVLFAWALRHFIQKKRLLYANNILKLGAQEIH